MQRTVIHRLADSRNAISFLSERHAAFFLKKKLARATDLPLGLCND